MFENYKVFETTFAGRPVKVETGKVCGLSNGSCWVTYGETMVMANITASQKPREGIDFFPLSVDFEDKIYSVGKIPGSFMKREGRPTEMAILTSRLVDRPIRPLFPKDMRNDVSLVMTVLSNDMDNAPEVTGMLASSIAISISDIPFNGIVASVSVGLVDGEIIVNPNLAQREVSELDLTVCASAEKIVMIEAAAKEVPEDIMLKAIEEGHNEIKKIIEFIAKIQKEIGKQKFTFESQEVPADMYEAIKAFAIDDIKKALDTDDKNVRDERLFPITTAIHEKFDEQFDQQTSKIDECIYKLQKYVVRRWLLDEGKRVDGRRIDQIRPLASEVGCVPRVHGSGLFTRGQTQVLAIATLGTISEAQIVDGITEEKTKRYMHHYNFPSYSVGETRPSRGPGRREIGHGALAEKALVAVLPSVEKFPYAIRVVSEILSSNGSTSQGAICASTLALMDAGVPITAPVAGISCGLITEGESWKTMMDIQGLEDFYGDMDFKVGGTKKGITAIQVDMKVDGITLEIIADAFETTKKGRMFILDEYMLKAIPEYRESVSKLAPKMLSTKIKLDKIREVIGQGGKVIQKLCADYDVKIDISEDGNVYISGIDGEKCQNALNVVETIANDPEVGAIYKGKVTKILAFGAFVEIAPGKEGLVHISKLEDKRVEKVEDVVSEGDQIVVKVMEIDSQGRINLSRKDAIADIEAKKQS
jgi:polyribonucleotide nucleotidyltransferase